MISVHAELDLVAAAKLGLTVLGLAGGASIGREGPTVHVGAAIMHALGRRFGHADPLAASRYLLAGGAAGLAAACDMAFVIMQRYNRPRLIKLMEMQKRKAPTGE